MNTSEEVDGMLRRRSTRLSSQNHASEEGAGMAPRRSPRLHSQVQASEEGDEVARRRSPRLHPQIQAREEGAEVTRRRSCVTSPAEPASLPDNDDMLREILLRLPPQPSTLHRASAVCKRWRGLIKDPRFQRQFRGHHRKPPLLGIFTYSSQGIVFTPILHPPDRIPPQRFDLGGCSSHIYYDLLDCRHGLVLVKKTLPGDVIVCDPITGEQRCVVVPSELKRGYLKGAVLCAAGHHGHVHGGCHLSSCKVVFVSIGRSDNQCLVCVYSLETGLWGNLISAEGPYELFVAENVPSTLVGNCLYWSKSARILEFDLDRQNLAVILAPPVTNGIFYGNHQIIQAVDGALGYAPLSYPRLELWQRNINGHGVATWVPWKTIEMHTILQLPSPDEGMWVYLLGYDEDDVVFLYYDGSAYMVQLKSMCSRKLNETPSAISRYFPFKSFFAPSDFSFLVLIL